MQRAESAHGKRIQGPVEEKKDGSPKDAQEGSTYRTSARAMLDP
jgi:hypothetical protein